MAPELTKLWLETINLGYRRKKLYLRANFDNDRHHAVTVEYPPTAVELARALQALASQISTDPHLA